MATKLKVRSMKNKAIANAKKDIIGRALSVKSSTPAQKAIVKSLGTTSKLESKPLKAWKKIKSTVVKNKTLKSLKPVKVSKLKF